MKIFRSANPSPLISIVTLAIGIFLLTACGIFSPGSGSNTSTSGVGWRVWIRTEPCAERFDWLSVAKEKGGAGTGSGLGSYVLYDTYLGAPAGFKSCTLPEPNGCTFAEATALMEALRPHPRFSDFCCRDFSVWRNSSTGKMAVVMGKYSTGGPSFDFFVQGNLCCEEAEALAGIPGACSHSQAPPPLGPVVRRTPGNTNTMTANGNTGGTDNNGGDGATEVVTTTPFPTQPPPPPPPPPPTPRCRLEGSWTQDTPGIGSTLWNIASNGDADETGIGYANGKASLNGNILHIDWQTRNGYSGYYEWTLNENCTSGKGQLVFKTGRTDSLSSTVKRN